MPKTPPGPTRRNWRGMSTLKYVDALNQTLISLMEEDPSIVICGSCCLNSPWYVGGLLKGIPERFPDRVIDGPCSENGVTGAAVGMALAGMKPIVIFPRHDFSLYAMDPIINHAAKISYMFGGKANCPIVFWMILNAKGSQGCQHSQDLSWIFRGIPGLKWVDEKNAADVGTALEDAVTDKNPVVFFDDRARYEKEIEKAEVCSGFWPMETCGCPAPASEVLEKEYYARLEG